MSLTVAEARRRFREEALARGANPRDVDLLLMDLTGRSMASLLAHGQELVDEEALRARLQRRFAGEPLQYIRGRAEFYSREFLVDRRVLIPRPETEILVETALRLAAQGARVVDVGTGSGCIAISMERERPDLRVIGTDCSLDALALARDNGRRLGSAVRFVACDMIGGLRIQPDVLVSNPPYIPASDIDALAAEVRDHEPRGALTPGARGTEAIEDLMRVAGTATLIMEIGYGQEEAVRALAAQHSLHVQAIIPDLAAIPRVVVSSRHGE